MILTVVIIAGSTLGLSLGQSSSGVRDCGHNEQCVSTEKCPEYLIKRKKLDNLPQLGPQYKRLLAELKSQVCNKAQRKICCPPTPPTPSGECGLSKLPSGFVRFDRNVTKYKSDETSLDHWRRLGRERRVPIPSPDRREKGQQRGLSAEGLSQRVRDSVVLCGQHHQHRLGPHSGPLVSRAYLESEVYL